MHVICRVSEGFAPQSFPYNAGTCTGVVVKVGDRTVMGRIAQLTSNIVEESEYYRSYSTQPCIVCVPQVAL